MALILVACSAMGSVGCGGRSEALSLGVLGDYCLEYPGDRFHCRGQRLNAEGAFDLLLNASEVPEDGVLVAVQSSPAGGLAPDGFHVEGSSWRVTYAVPGGDEYSYAVSSDRITVERTPSTADCVPGDEISVEGLTRKIQEATVLLETRFGVVYEPGTFSLNAGRSAASVSPAEQRQTLVHSQSQLPTSANHTVEFNELWPDGIICDLDLLGCE